MKYLQQQMQGPPVQMGQIHGGPPPQMAQQMMHQQQQQQGLPGPPFPNPHNPLAGHGMN
jgi:hypothetical protein